MDKYVECMAIVWITCHGISILIQPFVFGEDKGKHSPASWLAHILLTLIYLPIMGRILNWW